MPSFQDLTRFLASHPPSPNPPPSVGTADDLLDQVLRLDPERVRAVRGVAARVGVKPDVAYYRDFFSIGRDLESERRAFWESLVIEGLLPDHLEYEAPSWWSSNRRRGNWASSEIAALAASWPGVERALMLAKNLSTACAAWGTHLPNGSELVVAMWQFLEPTPDAGGYDRILLESTEQVTLPLWRASCSGWSEPDRGPILGTSFLDLPVRELKRHSRETLNPAHWQALEVWWTASYVAQLRACGAVCHEPRFKDSPTSSAVPFSRLPDPAALLLEILRGGVILREAGPDVLCFGIPFLPMSQSGDGHP